MKISQYDTIASPTRDSLIPIVNDPSGTKVNKNVLLSLFSLVITGTSAPASAPEHIGDIYVNTVADQIYVASGTSSVNDWESVSGDGNVEGGGANTLYLAAQIIDGGAAT